MKIFYCVIAKRRANIVFDPKKVNIYFPQNFLKNMKNKSSTGC